MKTKEVPFSLDLYNHLKSEGKEPVVKTKSGIPVRVICTDRKHVRMGPVVVLAQFLYPEREEVWSYHTHGRLTHTTEFDSPHNLVILQEVKEVRADDLSGLKPGDRVFDLVLGWGVVKDIHKLSGRITTCFDRPPYSANFTYSALGLLLNSGGNNQRLFRTEVTLNIPMVEV